MQRPTSFQTTHSADGTNLAYEIRGDGPPLVYVTGAICHRTFGPIRSGAKVLSSAFRVLTYDRRGRGDSDDSGPWSLDREVEDISALIDELGGSALLYGHSSGAVLAMHAAHRLGDRVQRVVMYDASWVADDAEAATYAGLRAEVDVLLARGRHGRALQRFLIGIGMPRVFTAVLPVMPGWRRMRALAPTLRHDLDLTAHPPPLEVAAAIDCPGARHGRRAQSRRAPPGGERGRRRDTGRHPRGAPRPGPHGLGEGAAAQPGQGAVPRHCSPLRAAHQRFRCHLVPANVERVGHHASGQGDR